MTTNCPGHSTDKIPSKKALLSEVAELRRQLAETQHELALLKSRLPETNRQLAHQRELLESLFGNIPILLVIWEPNLQRFTLNRYAETVLEWTTADANNGNFMDKVYPHASYRNQVAAFMQSLESTWKEWIATTKNQDKIPIEWTNIRLSDDTMVGIGIDLRERKKAERALQESQDCFLMAARAAGIGAYSRNLKTGEDYWSPEFLAVYGLGPGDRLPLEKGLPAAIHPEDRQELLSEAKARLKGTLEPEFDREHRILLPDGTLRWTISKGKIELDEQGEPSHTHGIVMDITERKELEEKLLESERRFRTVIENSRDGIHQFDLSTKRYVFMSPSQEKLTGFSADELQMNMKSASERLHPEDRPKVERWMERLMAGEDIKTPMEYRWLVKNGGYRWFSDSRSIVRNDRGEPIALVGNSRDITNRKQMEKELRQAHDELEMRVRKRTTELQKRMEQLAELSSELNTAEQREQRRIARILHDDLQQILAAAKLRLEVLEGKVQSDHREEVKKIHSFLTDSIHATRSLSKELSPPVLGQADITPMLEWLTGWADERYGLRVDLKTEKRAEIEEEDIRGLIFRCIRELLFNITKHAGVNRADIACTPAGKGCLKIIICDNGEGFDRDVELIKQQATGGFGLNSIQERLYLIGGRLDIESSPGEGTRFTMTVPAKAQPFKQIRN